MKLSLYSLYDRKTQVFFPPFSAVNEGDAIRSMMNLLTKDNNMTRYPEDFELFEVGSFTDSTGALCGKIHCQRICGLDTLRDTVYETKKKENMRLFDGTADISEETSSSIKEVKKSNQYKEAQKNAQQKR